MVPDSAMTGEWFVAHVRKLLATTLRRGDVVLDDLGCRKVVGVAEAVVAAGGRVVCPPAYSPDLNPIELAFAKLKAEMSA
jgi:transposase